MREALMRRIEAMRDEVVALNVDLVRLPTVSPPGDADAACAECVCERLCRLGCAVEYVRHEA